MAKTWEVKIVDGPCKMDLMFSLFEEAEECRKRVKFITSECGEGYSTLDIVPFPIPVYFEGLIDMIERVAHSSTELIVKMHITSHNANVVGKVLSSFVVSGCFNSQTRKGSLDIPIQ